MPHGMAHFGNISTEDLVQMFSESGVETGVDFEKLLAAGRRIRDLLGLEETSSAALAGGTKADVLERGKVAPRAG
jgi:hydroxymethylglutaryl-CoA lyase